jgi:hypothetical protein
MCVCLIMCDLETSTMRQPRHNLGCFATGKSDIMGYTIHTDS